MSVVQQERRTRDGGFDLQVLQSGMDITVKAGSFRIKGQDFTLAEDEVFTAVADATYDTAVVGYLCQDLNNGGQLALVVDEVLQDGADTPARWDSTAYKSLVPAFIVNVPAGATTLDDVVVTARKLVDPDAEE